MNLKNNFSLSTLKRYFDFLKVKQSSSATLQRKISSLSSFADFLTKRGLIDSQDYSQLNLIVGSVKSKRKHFDYPHFLNRYFVLGSLIALFLGLAYSLYQQSVLKARQQLAYSTAAQPVRPGRIMSFQGRLTDSVGNPITSSTAINFKFFNSSIGGTQLYDSAIGNSQVVVPDSNGIFNVVIGKSHGSEIPQNVFSENPEVWLQITTGNEVMEPRQQIATVAYALNSETLQGLPPSSTGEKNTVVILDNQGNLNLGESSPAIISQSGTFSLEGQSILIKADDGGGGGGIKLLTEGTAPATGGFVDFSNPNISSGNLLNSQITNTNRGYNFISFQNYNIGTSQLSTRFSVDANGNGIFSNNLSVGSTLTTNTLKATQAQDTNLVTNLNADLLDGYHANNLPYDNYRYWTAAAGGNTSNIGSTSTLNFVGGHGVGVTLSGNTLTFTNTSIGTTYAAGIALSLTPTNVFNLRYNPTLAIDTNNQVGLNLDNSNTWTVVQNFNNNFTVGSTTKVTNLNADLLDGLDSTAFVGVGQTGSLPYVNNAYDSTLTRYGTGPYTLGLNLANSNTWTIIQRFTAGIGVTGNSTFTNNLSVGGTLTTTTLKATNAMDTTVVTNLNADLLDGLDSTAFVGVGQTGNFLTDIIAGQGINVTGTGTNRTVALNLGATNTWLAPQNFSQNFTVGSTAVIANLNADLLDGLSSSQFLQVGGTGYDNYQYWTATAGLNTVNVGSTSTLNFASGGGLSIVLSGNTLTFTSTGIGTTYNAGTALSLAAGNTFNVLYDSSFAVNGTNQLGLNLGNSNTWTAVQNFNNNFTVGSTTKVTNLNADLLDGLDSTAFVGVGQTGSLPYVNNATNATLTRSGTGPYTLGLNLANANTWTALQTFNASGAPFAVGSTTKVTNLNADLLDGLDSSAFLQVGGTGYFSIATNGLQAIGSTAVGLGGTLTQNTVIDQNNFNLSFLNGKLGLGTTVPTQQLDMTGNINLTNTTFANQNGVIYKNGVRFLHNFNYGNNGTTTTYGNNLFLGENAGNFTMGSTATSPLGASNNIGIGSASLYSNTTGYYNTALGTSSLYYNTTGSNNVALGVSSLYYNTTGSNNVALGVSSLQSNTTGFNNIALGYASLYSNTTGSSNTALGSYSLFSNTTGSSNTALGSYSLSSNTTGSANTTLGNYSLQSNTTGYYNVALGYNAGRYLANGSTGNTSPNYSLYLGIGTKSLADNSQNEIVIGYNAIGNGSNSVTLGSDAITKTILKGKVGIGTTNPTQALDINGSLNVGSSMSIGSSQLVTNLNSDMLDGLHATSFLQVGGTGYFSIATNGLQAIGSTAVGLGGTLTQNTVIDQNNFNLSFLNGKLGLGTTAPTQQLDMTGNINLTNTTFANQNGVIYKDGVPFLHNFRNTNTDGNNLFLGENAGNFTMGVGASYNYESSNNIGIGSYALSSNTTGYQNTALGNYSLYSNTTGSDNTALGHASLQSNTTGSSNTALGHASLQFNTTSWGNTALGNFSLQSNTTGWGNTALGNLSFLFNTDGYYNIAIGNQAGNYLTDGSTGNTSPDYSIYIGANTTSLVDNSQNEIVIGYNATGNGSNSVTLGADTINKTILKGNVGLGTTAPSKKLDIVGDINLTGTIFANGTAGTNGQVLASTGTGLQWGNAAALTNPTNGLQLINTDSIGLGGTLTQNTIINNPNHSLSIIGQSNTVGLHVSNIGTVAIGTSTPEGIFHIAGRGVANQNFRFDWASNDANYKPTLFTVRARDNSGVNSPVINGDSLFMHEISGIAGSGIPYSAARWGGGVDGTVAATSVPGYLYFSTTTEGNTGPTERMRITSTGNIGIGTTLPTSMLDVTISNGWDGISLHSNTGNGIAYLAGDSSHNGLLQLYPNSSTYTVKITSSGNSFFNGGNVGIGTSSPISLLNLRGFTGGTAGSAIADYTKNLVIGGTYNSFYNSGNAVLLHLADYSNDAGDNVYPIYVESENNNVDFYIKAGQSNGTGTAYFGGNVGIGTASPTALLHVTGSQSNTISSSTAIGKILGYDAGIHIGNLAGTPNYGAWIQATRADNMAFPLLLNPLGGNVGIGTTSPGGLLQLGDIYTSGGKNLIIGDDTYLTDVDAAHTLGLYSNSNTAYGSLKLSANGGTISGYNGNIGIGTGSPQYTLDVNGTIRLGGITGQDQTIENNYGNYLHLGAWGVNRTATNAVLVNTAYMADLADQLDGHHADTAYNSFGNGTVPVRHPSGYLYTNYLNTSADVTATAPTHFAIQTGSDNFIRWQTLDNVRSAILSTDSVNQNALAANSVGQSEIKEANGSATGSADANVVMNDYNFYPSVDPNSCTGFGNMHFRPPQANVTDDYVARGRINLGTSPCSSGTWRVAWRYITASDRPTIWLVVNKDQSIYTVWEAEDPIGNNYPENPNPFEGETLQPGQYPLSVEPLDLLQLENIFNQLPQTDSQSILIELKKYIVNNRQWLNTLNTIYDINNISERYQPAARFWAMRFIAKHYDIGLGELIMYLTTVSNNQIEPKQNFLSELNDLRALKITNQAINDAAKVIPKADMSEWYTSDSSYEPGNVMTIKKELSNMIVPSTIENDPSLIGIISTTPYSTMGTKTSLNDVQIALNGRVPVKIDPSSDPIKPGDPITSSGNSGLAKKSIKAGAIIGKALEKWDPGSEKNSVMVFINISWYDPDVFLSDTGQVAINYNVSDEVLASLGYSGTKNELENGSYSLTDNLGHVVNRVGQFGRLAVNKLTASLISSKSVITDNLAAKHVASETIVTGNLVSTQIGTTELTALKIGASEASFSTLYADQIINPEGNISDVMSNKISSLRDEIKSFIASASAAQATPSAIAIASESWDTSVATDSAQLTLDNLTLTGDLVIGAQLTVTGQTLLKTAAISDMLTVGQIALKDNILETTADTLYIQPSGLGAVNILNGRLVVNSDGNININANVTVSGSLVADLLKASEIETQTLTTEKLNIGIATTSPEASPSSDNNATAGFITLATGQTEVTINNSRLTANSMVYLTPNGSTQNQVPYIKNKTEDNFTIAIDSPLDHDIDINWWLIN